MTEPSSTPSDLRTLIRTPNEKFQTYNRHGKTLPGVEWLPLSGGAEANKEIYERATEPYGSELAELDEKLRRTRDEVHKHVR